jgi:hypothetical protein
MGVSYDISASLVLPENDECAKSLLAEIERLPYETTEICQDTPKDTVPHEGIQPKPNQVVVHIFIGGYGSCENITKTDQLLRQLGTRAIKGAVAEYRYESENGFLLLGPTEADRLKAGLRYAKSKANSLLRRVPLEAAKS